MKATKKLTLCGILTALCVVILIVGSFLGLGIYAAPMLAGLLLIPVGLECGKRYQITTWAAISILSVLLVPDVEEKLMFIFLLGWYPVLSQAVSTLPRLLQILIKLVVFNGAVIALEALLMLVLMPDGESFGKILLIILLVLANVVFFLYDMLIPRFTLLYQRRFRKYLSKLL